MSTCYTEKSAAAWYIANNPALYNIKQRLLLKIINYELTKIEEKS